MYYFWILIVGSVFLLNCVTTKDIEVQDLNDVESSYGTKTALDAWRRVFRTQQNIFDELDNERFLRTYLRRKCKQRKTTTTTTTTMSTTTTTEESDSDSPDPHFIGKEHGIAELKCNATQGHKIRIVHAYYGVEDTSKCPPTALGPVTKLAGQRKETVSYLCGEWTQSQCSFAIESSLLGDSCKGFPKTLRIAYTCSRPE